MAIYGGEIIRIMQPGTYSYSCDTAVDPIAPIKYYFKIIAYRPIEKGTIVLFILNYKRSCA